MRRFFQRIVSGSRFFLPALLIPFCFISPRAAVAQPSSGRAIGPGSVLVHGMFGGEIFGFDIDQNGNLGVLTEATFLDNGKLLAAVETFDQTTGKIVRVVKKIQSKDDFITLGVVGNGIGLVEREHVKGIFVSSRIYSTLSPLSAKKFNGTWTPPLTKDDILTSVSRIQGAGNTAFLGFENGGDNHTFVFGSDVTSNTFGQKVVLPDNPYFFANGPLVAYDSLKNRAVVAASDGAVGGPPPEIALIDFVTGKVSQIFGIPGPPPFHQGFINGLAVDSADGIACTTTELDFRVEFYNLKKKTGFAVVLPGATGQLQSGSDVEFDPVNKLFLVAQSVSSTGPGSSIQVYDTKGNLVESLDSFNFSNAFSVVRTHIALNPSNRTGYVDGPEDGGTSLQSFSY
jgi:hypothetical protein